MKSADAIRRDELRDYLSKGWLTHDGMWFMSAYQALGIEKTNELNLAAIRALAPVEMKRAKKTLGLEEGPIRNPEVLKEFMVQALHLTMPREIMDVLHVSSPEDCIFGWEWEDGKCFAYQGMVMLGIPDRYRCGVIYRIECWLDALGVEYEIDPKIERCIMHQSGSCRGGIRFTTL